MPDLPLATLVTAALAVTLAYTVFGLTGFGAAIVGVPLLATLSVPIRFAVPMMLVFDLCAGLLLGLRNRRDVDRDELLRIAPFVAIGMVLGVTALCTPRALAARRPRRVRLRLCVLEPVRGAPRPIGRRLGGAGGHGRGVFTALYGSGVLICTVYLARRLDDANRLRQRSLRRCG